jgi:NAD(P)-dependent dehydrogenase (short-subunit alcohol dehydrogenase family)
MGQAAAKLFAAEGARVAINDLHADAADATLGAIESSGGEGMTIACDVSDRDRAIESIRQVVARWGGVDILVNCAGHATIEPATTYSVWDRMLSVNLSSHFHWSQAVAVQSMIASKSGAIVNIASIAGLVAYPGDVGYIAAKAGLIGLTRALAIEWAPHGIRVNCICPGLTDTPMIKAVEKIDPDRFVVRRKRVPMARPGRPEELADAIAYLASDQASYVTGVSLNVDGGQIALSSGWSPA